MKVCEQLEVQQTAIMKQENSNSDKLHPVKSENIKFEIADDPEDTTIKVERLVCEELDIKTETDQSISDSLRETIIERKLFSCALCNEQFICKTNLQRHLSTRILFECKICDYVCIRKCVLRKHQQSHVNEKYKSIAKQLLQQHAMKTHAGEKLIKCGVWDYSTNSKNYVRVHMKIHTGEELLRCGFCDYQCITKHRLEEHIRTHTGEKPFNCSICDYSSITNVLLQRHMKRHGGENLFKCGVCAFASITKHQLETHLKIHTGDYRCVTNEGLPATYEDTHRQETF